MANLSSLVLLILMLSVFSVAAKGKQYLSVNFTVYVNVSKGEDRFDREIGKQYTEGIMSKSAEFVRDTLVTYNTNVKKVSMFIEDMVPTRVASKTTGNEIHVNARYIQSYKGSVKTEFTGIVFNNMARVLLLNGRGVPETVLSGIADYVRLKADYERSDWVNKTGGEKWDEKSDVTARFFDFCEHVTHGFVTKLCNQTKTNTFDINQVFKTHFQQTLERMWFYYKNGLPP